MVSNSDRIYLEIKSEAERVKLEHNVAADTLTLLVMEIVNIEDQNRVKPLGNVNQQIENMIEQAAKVHARKREG